MQASLLAFTVVPLFTFGALYALGSFTAGSTDPTLWTQDSRAFLVVAWVVVTFVTLAGVFDMADTLNKTHAENERRHLQNLVDQYERGTS